MSQDSRCVMLNINKELVNTIKLVAISRFALMYIDYMLKFDLISFLFDFLGLFKSILESKIDDFQIATPHLLFD